jgi:hypothetical protein
MSKLILSAVLAAMVLSFVGYSEEVKTVNYYKQHISEQKAKIAECKNNPGELRGTPNCINALTAERMPKNTSKMPDINRVANPSKYENF